MFALSLREPASQARVSGPKGGPFRVLARLFARRFLENDLLSTENDTRVSLGMVVALLAAPGAFSLVWLLLAYSGPFITPSERMLMALGHKYQFIAVSLLLAGLVATLEWDAMAVDGRDSAILGALPIPPGRLLAAKVAALGLFLLALTGAVNLVPTLAFPLIWVSLVPIGVAQAAWLTLVHGLVSLAAAATGFFAVVAARSLFVLVCPHRALRGASTVAQFTLVFCFGTLLLLTPVLSPDVPSELERPTQATLADPVMWLLGGYERLTARALYANPRFSGPATWKFWAREQLRRERYLGREVWAHPLPIYRTEEAARRRYHALLPALDRLAAIGSLVLPLLAAASSALYVLAHRWRRRQREILSVAFGERKRVARSLRGRLRRRVTPDPISQATFVFTLQALLRSGPQRLRVAGALALGCAAAFFLLLDQVDGPAVFPSSPTASFLALEYLVAFFLLAGVRRAFSIPAALPANWLFRITLDGAEPRRARAGIRRAVVTAVVLPLFSVLALLHAAAWGPAAGVAHLAVGILLTLVLVEILLSGLDRIPFTSPYVSRDAPVRAPFQLAGLVLFAYGSGFAETIALSDPRTFAVVAAATVVAVSAIRLSATRHAGSSRALTFSEQPDQAVQTLGI